MGAPIFLVVDPNPRFLEKSEEILHEDGYRVVAAANGLDARSYLDRERPTGVLSSINIDGLDGLDLCRLVKERFRSRVPVILMCPEDPESIALAMSSGADNVLFRPVKRAELLFCARSLLRLNALLYEQAELAASARLEPTSTGSRSTQFEFFKAFLSIEMKRARRYGFPLSLMLLTLDRMDQIERRYSREALRQVLAGLTLAIQRSVRDIDIPVTLQDDSILVLMPHTDNAGAFVVADRVRQRIRRSVYHEGDLYIQPTLSVGLTTYVSAQDVTFSQVIGRASEARREAERQGGDQVVVF